MEKKEEVKSVEIVVQQVMDRKKIAHALHAMLDAGIDMLRKSELTKDDFGKLKVMRTLSSNVTAAVLMVQQETAQQRTALVAERMRQLGYSSEIKQLA